MRLSLMRPTHAGELPSCILLPEIFGLTEAMYDAARRLARADHVVAMPDLNHRWQPNAVYTEDEDGRKLGLAALQQLRRDSVMADIGATLDYLAARRETSSKTAVLGFSSGGHVAYLAASAFDFDVAIVVYAGWLTNTDIPLSQPEPTLTLTGQIGQHRTYVLYVVGSDDHLISKAQVGEVETALTNAGVPYEMVVCAGARHGFMVPGRATFDPVAAEETWQRILSHCAERLR